MKSHIVERVRFYLSLNLFIGFLTLGKLIILLITLYYTFFFFCKSIPLTFYFINCNVYCIAIILHVVIVIILI